MVLILFSEIALMHIQHTVYIFPMLYSDISYWVSRKNAHFPLLSQYNDRALSLKCSIGFRIYCPP